MKLKLILLILLSTHTMYGVANAPLGQEELVNKPCTGIVAKGTVIVKKSKAIKSEGEAAYSEASNLLKTITEPIACNKANNKAVLEQIKSQFDLFSSKKEALTELQKEHTQLVRTTKINYCVKEQKALQKQKIATLNVKSNEISSQIAEIEKGLNQSVEAAIPPPGSVKTGVNIHNSIEMSNKNQLIFSYEDQDDGEYIIRSLNTSSDQYWDYVNNIIDLLKKLQQSPCGASTIRKITIQVAERQTDLSESADIQYGDEYRNFKDYNYNGKLKQLALRDGDDINFEQLDALKGISIKSEILSALNAKTVVEVHVLPGQPLEGIDRKITITIDK